MRVYRTASDPGAYEAQAMARIERRAKKAAEEFEVEEFEVVREQLRGRTAQSKNGAVDVSGNDPEMQRLSQPRSAKPAVTAEQYARGREVLDALPPGVYLKCSNCFKWQMGGDISFRVGRFLCEKCA